LKLGKNKNLLKKIKKGCLFEIFILYLSID
jgi:hypothetical protein